MASLHRESTDSLITNAFCYIIFVTDTWALQELCGKDLSSTQPPPPPPQQEDDNSGVEMESPHNSAMKDKEFTTTIPRVGKVSTWWVGHKGRQDIKRILEECLRTERSELKNLARECKEALVALGAENSTDPQVEKAIALFNSHLPSVPLNAIP